jgi:hypothetical protein
MIDQYGNPWEYPGMYAYPNTEDVYEVEPVSEDESFRSGLQLVWRVAVVAAIGGTVALAVNRGNSIPRAIGAGLVWPFYLGYVAVKSDT